MMEEGNADAKSTTNTQNLLDRGHDHGDDGEGKKPAAREAQGRPRDTHQEKPRTLQESTLTP